VVQPQTLNQWIAAVKRCPIGWRRGKTAVVRTMASTTNGNKVGEPLGF